MTKLLGLAAAILFTVTLTRADLMTIIAENESVYYRFNYDLNLTAFSVSNTGIITYQTSQPQVTRFYTDFQGDYAAPVSITTPAEFNFGIIDAGNNYTYLYGGESGNIVYLYDYGTTLSDWDVGTVIKAGGPGVGSNQYVTISYLGLAADAPAKPTSSVPEPSTVAMLLGGFGLLGIGSIRTRNRR